MIARYIDHAANERTFLAWIRTGRMTLQNSGAVLGASAQACLYLPKIFADF
jgi:uncharacterized membrane protein YidH (DUF202 family)